MRWTVIVTFLALALAGCRGRPQPIYEYEPPVTITSIDEPGPRAGPTGTTVPSRAPVWLKREAR